jgi:hypothetical protein
MHSLAQVQGTTIVGPAVTNAASPAPGASGDQIAAQYVTVLAVNTNPDGSVGFVTPDPRALTNAEMKMSVKALEDAIAELEYTMEELRKVFKEDIRKMKEKGLPAPSTAPNTNAANASPPMIASAAPAPADALPAKKTDTKLKLEMARQVTAEGSLAPPSTPTSQGAESARSGDGGASLASPTGSDAAPVSARSAEHKRAKSDKDAKDKSSSSSKSSSTPRDGKRTKASRSRENSLKCVA